MYSRTDEPPKTSVERKDLNLVLYYNLDKNTMFCHCSLTSSIIIDHYLSVLQGCPQLGFLLPHDEKSLLI